MRMIASALDDSATDEETGQEAGDIFEVLACRKCQKPTIRSGFWYEGMDDEEWQARILYPPRQKVLTGLPPSVQREYDAARQVAGISPDAYAVLLGRVFDAVCEESGAEGKDLHSRLEYLASEQLIPKRLVDLAQNLRGFRNVGAHANLGTLTSEEIPFLGALSNAVLEYMYEAPKLLEEAQSRLDKIRGR
jgi:hypothetical protein